MAQTTQKLVYDALSKLGRLYVGEAPANEDFETVASAINPLIAMLAADPRCGVVIEDPNAIEDRFYPSLVLLLAVEVAPQFGTSAAQNLAGNAGFASVRELQAAQMNSLKVIAAREPTYQTLKATYF
jgi:hypothetical protein